MTDKTEYKSKFEQVTGANASDVVADGEREEWVPRAIYTADAHPDPKKISVPTLRLAQGMTAEVTERKAQIGQFVLTNFPPCDEVVLIPFAAQDIRVLKESPQAPPQCQAPTGNWGIGNPGGDCSQCPMSKWGGKNPATGKSTPPRCKEGISLRAYSVRHRSMVDFVFMGGSSDKGAFIQQQAMAFGFNAFAIRLTSTGAKNEKGAWFVPEIEMIDEIPADHAEIASKWYELFRQSIEPQTEAIAASS